MHCEGITICPVSGLLSYVHVAIDSNMGYWLALLSKWLPKDTQIRRKRRPKRDRMTIPKGLLRLSKEKAGFVSAVVSLQVSYFKLSLPV